MTDWELDCMHWYGEILQGDFKHWCYDWDDLPIDEHCSEFMNCTCDFADRNVEADAHREAHRKAWEAEMAANPQWNDFALLIEGWDANGSPV